MNAAELLKVVTAYWSAQAVLTGTRLGLFDVLTDHSRDLRTLARITRCDARALDQLLHALVALGLVKKRGDRFRLTAQAAPLLSSKSSRNLLPLLQIHHDRFADWAKLSRVVRRGKPLPAVGLFVKPVARTRRFIDAMEAMARHGAHGLVEAANLSGHRHLLDVGGGSGAYSIALCRAYPSLKATILELPGTLTFTRKYVREAGMLDRISFLAGDYHSLEFRKEYDAILVSHILHSIGPKACQALLTRLSRALRRDGVLLVREFFLDRSRTRSTWPALFSLNMLLWTAEGRTYSWYEVETWLRRAGLRRFRRASVPLHEGEGLLTATR